MPGLVVCFFIARGVPGACCTAGSSTARRVAAAGLLQATSLSVPVVAVRIGVQLHTIDSDTGAAIIAAGLLTVVLFPPIAHALSGGAAGPERTDGPADDPVK